MAHWIVLENADRLLDPASGVDTPGSVWIREGVIAHLAPDAGRPPELRPEDRISLFDASGLVVTPMFIDLHVHLREPGGEESETIRSGAAAALRGGYATVFAMPNTQPTCDEPALVEATLASARAAGPVEVVPISALSRGLRGEALVDLEAMAAAGAGAFSDDGTWLADERLARDAFRWAARNDVQIMQHCEDFQITGPGVLHGCGCVEQAGFPGIPREAEDRAVRRDIELAAGEHARLHVCHVSTRGAVEAIRKAQAEGLPVTGEVTPHHLVFTAEDALRGGTDFKMKPPLREADDVAALIEGLSDGTIQAVATDHAPHSDASKARGLLAAPFGAIGVETAFPVLYTCLVQAGALPLKRLVAALTSGPSGVVGREPPSLRVGADARLNLLDLQGVRSVDRLALASASHNCPFHGLSLSGWPLASVLAGRIHLHVGHARERNRTIVRAGELPGLSPGSHLDT